MSGLRTTGPPAQTPAARSTDGTGTASAEQVDDFSGMALPAFQDSEIDENGNPGMPITGCPNCGTVVEPFTGHRYLSIIGHAALLNGRQQHPNDPCTRACRLQLEHAEALKARGVEAA